jgi:uncharacterized sulfatase
MKKYKMIISLLGILLLLISTVSVGFTSNTDADNSSSLLERPNIIFYLSDDQDQLDYGCYGNPKVKTPNVDQLALEGMSFTNFYTAQAICSPARSQIFTGMYPFKNGCMANHIGVKRNIKSITQYLKAAGYEIVLAGKSHVKPNKVFQWTHYFPPIDKRFLPMDKIESYIKNAEKPFCIFLASDFPHGPYPSDGSYTKKNIHRLPYNGKNIPDFKPGYYQNIESDDQQLGEIIKMVDKYGLRNKSMFIYAADHGISGKWGLSEQGLKVPFVVRWPGKIKPNTSSDVLLSLVDILPTLLEVADVKLPENVDGKSFSKVLEGKDTKVNDYIFGVASNQNIQKCLIFPSRMVRGDRYKLIKNFNALEVYESNLGADPVINEFIKIGANAFPQKPYEELYDLENDPYQKKNLAKNPEYLSVKEKLSAVLENWMGKQNDFLLTHKMPLLKPTLHPLDRNSKWNKVPSSLEGKLTEGDYLKLHY